MPKRAGLHVRMSQDRTGEGAGVERQEDDERAYAARRGWSVERVWRENDVSTSKGRKAKDAHDFRDMIRAIRDGEIDVLITWVWDRIGRHPRENLDFIEACQSRPGFIVAQIQGPELDLSTAVGEMVAHQMANAARFEVRMKTERQTRERRQVAEKGHPASGPRAFGYSRDGRQFDTRERRPATAIFEQILAGRTLSAIAAGLNDAGFVTTAGNPWKHNSVRAFALNPRNAGLRAYRGDVIGSGAWPALVSEDVWRTVKGMLESPDRRKNHHNARRWLGTNIYRCGVCDDGTTMICTYREGGRRVYRCREAAHLLRTAEPIDALIERLIVAWASSPDAERALVNEDEPDWAALQRDLDALRKRSEQIAEELGDEKLSTAQFLALNRRLDARIAELEEKLIHRGRRDVLGDLVYAEDPAAVWDHSPLDRKRAMLATIAEVTILRAGPGRRVFDPATVRVALRGGRGAA
jgi:site-specific DNA recombinase